MTRVLALVMMCFMTLFFLAPAQAGGSLSNSDLNKLFPGNFVAIAKGYTIRVQARSGGTLIGNYKGIQKDKGRWNIQSNKICIMLEKWLKGKTYCGTVQRAGKWYRSGEVKFRKQ